MRLLLAVDIRRADADALVRRAGQWAQRMEATLDLAYADPFGHWKPRTYNRTLMDKLNAQLEREREALRRRLRALLEHVPEGHRGEGHLLAGDAGAEIHRKAGEYDALVLGPGERLSDQVGIASNAARMVRGAPGPVLVLPRL